MMVALLALLGSMWLSPPCDDGRCRCLPPPPVAEAALTAEAVFTGTVTGMRDTLVELGRGFPPSRMRLFTFQVERTWKGVESETVVVLTGQGGGDCGIPFSHGEAYLIFAHARASTLHTNICSRTSLLARAEADIRELDAMVRHPGR